MSNLREADGGIFHILTGVLGGRGSKVSNKRKSQFYGRVELDNNGFDLRLNCSARLQHTKIMMLRILHNLTLNKKFQNKYWKQMFRSYRILQEIIILILILK